MFVLHNVVVSTQGSCPPHAHISHYKCACMIQLYPVLFCALPLTSISSPSLLCLPRGEIAIVACHATTAMMSFYCMGLLNSQNCYQLHLSWGDHDLNSCQSTVKWLAIRWPDLYALSELRVTSCMYVPNAFCDNYNSCMSGYYIN